MTTKKVIEKLTPAQEALLPVYRDKWIKIGLDTTPCDRPACEAAVKLAYEKADQKPPSRVVWLRSPLAGAIAADMLANDEMQKFDDFVADEEQCLRSKAKKGKLNSTLLTRASNQITNACYGSHDANWLAFYDYFKEVVGIEEINRLDGVFAMSGCGWWWPFEDIAILTERPTVIKQDSQGRMHCTEGPAIAYSDGFELYAVHGIMLEPDSILKPLTVKRIDDEQNAEVRRVLLELYGMSKYLLNSKSKILDKSRFGILYQKDIRDDEPLTMVRVLNSTPEPDGTLTRDEAIAIFGKEARCVTGDFNAPLPKAPKSARFKEYTIRVPQNMKTAREAVAWTFHMKEEEYNPDFES